MLDEFRQSLRELTPLPGISGHEDPASAYMARHLGELADEVSIDLLGNVIARFGAKEKPAAAVMAHIDTVGFLVKRVNPDGSLGVVPVGGVNLKALPGTPVRVGDLPGVIGIRSQHQAQPNEAAVSADDLYIHVGTGQSVEITTPITYATSAVELAGNFWSSPYLDNRAGCAVLLALARLLKDKKAQTVYLIGTVQEETTCQGAYHALDVIRPDAALFVDGTVSYDTPDTRGRGSVSLGAGPVLTSFLYTSGLNGWHAHPSLRSQLKRIAEEVGFPYQQDAVHGLMSDARAVTPLGIPSALVGLPMRGKHSPMEMISLDDLVIATRLLYAFLERPLPSLQR